MKPTEREVLETIQEALALACATGKTGTLELRVDLHHGVPRPQLSVALRETVQTVALRRREAQRLTATAAG